MDNIMDMTLTQLVEKVKELQPITRLQKDEANKVAEGARQELDIANDLFFSTPEEQRNDEWREATTKRVNDLDDKYWDLQNKADDLDWKVDQLERLERLVKYVGDCKDLHDLADLLCGNH